MCASRYAVQCWLTPSAEVGCSAIDGEGLFAISPIRRGELVMRLGGRIIDDAALAGLTEPYSSLIVEPGTHLLIDPADPVRYGNHSCDPSLWHADVVTITARREIAVGEELTIDYSTHTGTEDWAMTCHCGSDICRGVVTGSDWQLRRLQEAYGDHWSPPLLDRIRASPPYRVTQ